MEAAADAGGHGSGAPEGEQRRPKTLVDWALQILSTADPDEKARLGDLAASMWLRGEIPVPYDPSRPAPPPPDRPARSAEVRLLPPSRMPKLGKGGSAQSRLAMLHSLAHTESWAVDLSWDIIARFGAPMRMPRGFFDDFARLAQDEGRHYTVLSARLRELGSRYGALPAHDGLWDSAMSTAHCLLARLAVEHCVHEVRSNACVVLAHSTCYYQYEVILCLIQLSQYYEQCLLDVACCNLEYGKPKHAMLFSKWL
jgi:uncharacterized ferritin-like protein (DUF455 family)